MGYLTDTEKRAMLQLARRTIEARLHGKSAPKFEPDSERLRDNGAAFVTLHSDGELRGCIGYTEAFQPLFQTVQECAVSAAFADPRFHPLLLQEYPSITLEISVLTPMVLAVGPDDVEVGRHGLMIEAVGRRGLLLPQVATDQGWDRETFLKHTCYKACLPGHTWQQPETKIYLFEAEVFAETDFA
ncbi:MAG: AmmeMemoRadiSam system protein A [bacterium]